MDEEEIIAAIGSEKPGSPCRYYGIDAGEQKPLSRIRGLS